MFWHIPVANVLQCFSIQNLFRVSCYRLDKKIFVCPSLTQAVSITDAKSLRHNTKHFQCMKLSLDAILISLMGYNNIRNKLQKLEDALVEQMLSCAKCAKNLSKMCKCAKLYKNVQMCKIVQNCSKCAKLCKMSKVVQNVQNCAVNNVT